MKKKILTVAMTTALVATSVVGLTGCFNSNPQTPTNKKATAQDVFSLSAVSGATYLGHEQAGANGLAGALAAADFTRPDGITDKEIDDFKTYLTMFDSMLSNGGFDIKVSDPTLEDGKYAVKEEKEDGTKVLHGTKMEVNVANDKYTMFYTETKLNGDVEVDEDDMNEVKEATSLEGVLVRGEESYVITGGREVETETEEGESEKEVTITFETKAVDGSSVKVVQSVEEEIENGKTEKETTYGYTIKDAQGKIVTEYEIEWEVEDGATEMSVEMNGVEYEIKMVSENKFQVEFENASKEIEFEIEKVAEGKYNFIYGKGNVEEVVIDLPAEPAPETPVEPAPETPVEPAV